MAKTARVLVSELLTWVKMGKSGFIFQFTYQSKEMEAKFSLKEKSLHGSVFFFATLNRDHPLSC